MQHHAAETDHVPTGRRRLLRLAALALLPRLLVLGTLLGVTGGIPGTPGLGIS